MSEGQRKYRVLLVDDSRLVRELFRHILESDPDISVVGEAGNGAEALALVSTLKPDLVTMDIEMPVMGGLEAIERILKVRSLPILVVTAATGVKMAFDAVSRGALEVIEKPDISMGNFNALIRKVKILARVDMAAHLRAKGKGNAPVGIVRPAGKGVVKSDIIAIAASTGGPGAIQSVLSRLPAHFPAPIVIAQHIGEGFTQGMVEWLKSSTPLKVEVARHGAILSPSCVYVNPAENSMQVTGSGMILLGERNSEQLFNPNCNTLLISVAKAYRNRALGLIMSGMSDDGVLGMQALQKEGGTTFAQDEKSSVVFGMNKLAIAKGYVDQVLPLSDIPAELLRKVVSL